MNNDDKNFVKDKLVVITGATKGLGRALSLEFANAGYEVIGIYRSDTACAKDLETEFKARNFRGSFFKQDITDDGEWAEFDAVIKGKSGKHFTVIANACLPFVPKPFHLTDWSEFSEQAEVNVKGTFYLLQRLLPLMAKARQGDVITVLTAALDSPPKGFAAYLTAKSALNGLTKTVAAEYNARGIRVFSVSPGFMETSLTEDWSEHLKALIYANEGEAKSPAEIAKTIFDLSEDTKTIGQGENYLIGASESVDAGSAGILPARLREQSQSV